MSASHHLVIIVVIITVSFPTLRDEMFHLVASLHLPKANFP
jgi:hypothetical protein